MYPGGDATIGNIPVDIDSEESRKGWLDPSRRTEEYLTLDTSSVSTSNVTMIVSSMGIAHVAFGENHVLLWVGEFRNFGWEL